jgi:hypothetical protein
MWINLMENELFISQTPDGYSIKKRIMNLNNPVPWETVLRGGKSFDDLLSAIDSLPLSFRLDVINVNYGRPEVPFPFSNYEKFIIKTRLESL